MFLKIETMVAEKEEGLIFHLEAVEALVIGFHCSPRTILRNFLMRKDCLDGRCIVLDVTCTPKAAKQNVLRLVNWCL
jgi:hypothetical protein